MTHTETIICWECGLNAISVVYGALRVNIDNLKPNIMIGQYIECDFCGSIKRTTVSRTNRQFRIVMVMSGWVLIKNKNGVNLDFCSNDCYKNWEQITLLK